MINLQTALQFLMENGYVVSVKGKHKFTAKFNQQITGKNEGVIVHMGKAVVIESQLPVAAGATDWPKAYLNFIKEAQIPARCDNGHGKSYDINKYSEDGMKAFRKIIEVEKVPYQVLVLSTRLYYSTHKQHALKVGNYIAQGTWRSDVENLINSAKEGKVDQHIQNEINSNAEFSRYTVGWKGKTDMEVGTEGSFLTNPNSRSIRR